MTREEPRTSRSAASTPSAVAPKRLSTSAVSSRPRLIASSRCSVDRYSSWNSLAIFSAVSRICTVERDSPTSTSPATRAWEARRSSTAPATARGSAPRRCRIGATMPSPCRARASSRCSGRISACARSVARRRASCRACWALIVNRSNCMVLPPISRRFMGSHRTDVKVRGRRIERFGLVRGGYFGSRRQSTSKPGVCSPSKATNSSRSSCSRSNRFPERVALSRPA